MMKRATFRFWYKKKFLLGFVVNQDGEPKPNQYFSVLGNIAVSLQPDFNNIRDIIFFKVREYEARQEFVKIWGNYKPSKPFQHQFNDEFMKTPVSFVFFKNISNEKLWDKYGIDSGEVVYDIRYNKSYYPKCSITYLNHSITFTENQVRDELFNLSSTIRDTFSRDDDWLKDCDCKDKEIIL